MNYYFYDGEINSRDEKRSILNFVKISVKKFRGIPITLKSKL